jgi:hypothetical protein
MDVGPSKLDKLPRSRKRAGGARQRTNDAWASYHDKPHYLPAHNAANWFNAAHESYLYFRETPTSECTNLAASSEVVPRSHILSLLLG